MSLLALLYGDGEKPMETGAAKEDPISAARKAPCTCNKKPCGCQKEDVNYAFLHASGNHLLTGVGVSEWGQPDWMLWKPLISWYMFQRRKPLGGKHYNPGSLNPMGTLPLTEAW